MKIATYNDVSYKKDCQIVIDLNEFNTSFFNENNRNKDIKINITKKANKEILDKIIRSNFFKNIFLFIDKESFLDKEYLQQNNFKIKNAKNNRISYKALIYKMFFENNINEISNELKNFNLMYLSKLISKSVQNEKIVETMLNLEKYIYVIDNKYLYPIFSLMDTDESFILKFPLKIQKQKTKGEKARKVKILKNYSVYRIYKRNNIRKQRRLY